MPKVFKNYVHIGGEQYEPGDECPEELEDQIDDANFAEDDIEALGEAADSYKSMDAKELKQLLKDRELPQSGNIATMIKRLVADDLSGS